MMQTQRSSRVRKAAGDIQNFQRLAELLRAHAEKWNATARGLDDGSIHPAHTANRLRKMAKELGC